MFGLLEQGLVRVGRMWLRVDKEQSVPCPKAMKGKMGGDMEETFLH